MTNEELSMYVLVGLIAIYGLIGAVVFVRSWFKHGMRIAKLEVASEESAEEEEARHKFADELFRLSCIPTHLLSDEEFNTLLTDITSRKPKHMP